MKLLLKILGGVVGVIVLVVAGTLIGARFADGPLEIIAGGPFKTGKPVTEEPDWEFVRDYFTRVPVARPCCLKNHVRDGA